MMVNSVEFKLNVFINFSVSSSVSSLCIFLNFGKQFPRNALKCNTYNYHVCKNHQQSLNDFLGHGLRFDDWRHNIHHKSPVTTLHFTKRARTKVQQLFKYPSVLFNWEFFSGQFIDMVGKQRETLMIIKISIPILWQTQQLCSFQYLT